MELTRLRKASPVQVRKSWTVCVKLVGSQGRIACRPFPDAISEPFLSHKIRL